MLERFHQESAGACCRVKNCLPKSRINRSHDKLHQRPGRIELPGVSRSVPHLSQHALVEVPQCMNLVPRREINLIYFVHHVPQQIPVDHPIDGTLKDFSDNIPAVAVRTLQPSQICKQSRALLSIWPNRLFLVDEGYKLGTCHSIWLCCP